MMRVRSVAYSIFSRVFENVPDECSDRFCADTAKHIFELADLSDNEDFRLGAEMLEVFYGSKECPVELAASRDDRARDYTRLFVFGKLSVPINESGYTCSEKKYNSEIGALSFYSSRFLNRNVRNRSLGHISAELQFAGLLSLKAAAFMDSGNFEEADKFVDEQHQFNLHHLSGWASQFCDAVTDSRDDLINSFYPAHAYMLKGFLAEDMLFLKELME
ncbi:TorD/DmsD family molecular chaperone [Denitrovibrio acetiphilus]|nr:molecular chaperone TorD family protein [Denitrovibrio acetiphilus]